TRKGRSPRPCGTDTSIQSRDAHMKARLMVVVPAALLLAACASEIVNNSNGQCANLPWHGYPVDGTVVRIIPCIGRPGEGWNLKNGQIIGVGGSCMDVQGSNAA